MSLLAIILIIILLGGLGGNYVGPIAGYGGTWGGPGIGLVLAILGRI